MFIFHVCLNEYVQPSLVYSKLSGIGCGKYRLNFCGDYVGVYMFRSSCQFSLSLSISFFLYLSDLISLPLYLFPSLFFSFNLSPSLSLTHVFRYFSERENVAYFKVIYFKLLPQTQLLMCREWKPGIKSSTKAQIF